METTREIVTRLARYKNVLEKLRALGLVKVFSDNLADALGISAALVRKDFSTFGFRGNKRGGYRVDELIQQVSRILGRDEVQQVVIVGCGKIGTALMNYKGLPRERIKVVAGFDVDPAKVNPAAAIPVYDMSELADYVKAHHIRVAVLAVPEAVASQVATSINKAGIVGVLNFTPVLLRDTEDLVIHNINIGLELENLVYLVRLNHRTKERNA